MIVVFDLYLLRRQGWGPMSPSTVGDLFVVVVADLIEQYHLKPHHSPNPSCHNLNHPCFPLSSQLQNNPQLQRNSSHRIETHPSAFPHKTDRASRVL